MLQFLYYAVFRILQLQIHLLKFLVLLFERFNLLIWVKLAHFCHLCSLSDKRFVPLSNIVLARQNTFQKVAKFSFIYKIQHCHVTKGVQPFETTDTVGLTKQLLVLVRLFLDLSDVFHHNFKFVVKLLGELLIWNIITLWHGVPSSNHVVNFSNILKFLRINTATKHNNLLLLLLL